MTLVDISKLPETDPRRGYGAPTILVNGKDLFEAPIPKQRNLACRIYNGGLPSVAAIKRRLRTSIKAHA